MRRRARAIVIPPNTVLLAQASIVGEGFMGVNFIEDFGNVGNKGKRVKFPGVLGSMAPEAIPPHRLGDPEYRFPSRGRGWFDDPYKHSLAARGFKTAMEINPIMYGNNPVEMKSFGNPVSDSKFRVIGKDRADTRKNCIRPGPDKMHMFSCRFSGYPFGFTRISGYFAIQR